MPAVTGPLTTVNPSNTYATHSEGLGAGGYRSVADNTARDAITASRRTSGMLVHVLATDLLYKLAADLTTWVPHLQNLAYEGAAALRAKVGHVHSEVVILLWAVSEAGGGFGNFSFDSASTLVDDGIDVLIPNNITHPAPGRWRRRS